MAGALADWYIAAVALFRRIPIPFISRHTAIIPRNKRPNRRKSWAICAGEVP